MVDGTSPKAFSLHAYIAMLAVVMVALVVYAVQDLENIHSIPEWIFLSALFGVTESALLFFHHERGRQSLSASEAILFPMLFALSPAQLVLGVAAAMIAARPLQWREGLSRSVFNVSQCVVAIAASASVFSALSEEGAGFSVRNALAAALSVVSYAVVNHTLVTGAIALSERVSFLGVLKGVANATLWNLALSLSLGLFFAGAYTAGHWSVVMFPVAVAATFLGYRALLSQSHERERVEHLHAASRALAASPSLDQALIGFLKATREIASTRDARAVIETPKGRVWSGVRGSSILADMTPLTEGPMVEILRAVRESGAPLIVGLDDTGPHKKLVEALDVRSLIAAPLMEGEKVMGCLVATDRLGAEGFGPSEAKLLEALGDELVVTLDSHRLFAEVSEERERFRKIFDASKEGICLLDGEGVVRAWNPSLVRITGFTAEEILGTTLTGSLAVRDREHRPLQGLELVSVSPEEEFEIDTRDGQSRWISLLCSPTLSAEDKGWVVLVRDVTAEHLVEESKSDFLSTISHELRTPLTTIKGSMQILKRGPENLKSETVTQMMGVLSRGTDRLERLVLNLLFVSQIETDGLPKVIPEAIDLEGIVRDRVALFLKDHETVNLEIEEGLPVWGDRERVTQVVEHLVENAQKFSDFTPITVRIRSTPEGVELMVKDEGPGIPKVDQERVFERFVRLGHVLTRETQGPGVGLFIVEKSVEAMGGKVWLESAPGAGCAFHVLLPAVKSQVPAGAGS